LHPATGNTASTRFFSNHSGPGRLPAGQAGLPDYTQHYSWVQEKELE